MNNALLLLLLDSQAPAGAHHHSAGMEAAITAGLVTDLAGTEDFCQTRLRTSARVAASFAAASGRLFSAERADLDSSLPAELAVLDAEYEARVPSEATRRASRELGRGLWRLLRSVLRETDLVTAFSRCAGPVPHHPLVLGAGVALADGDPELAGRTWTRARPPRPGRPACRRLRFRPTGRRPSTCWLITI